MDTCTKKDNEKWQHSNSSVACGDQPLGPHRAGAFDVKAPGCDVSGDHYLAMRHGSERVS